jgi:hypothetical protein
MRRVNHMFYTLCDVDTTNIFTGRKYEQYQKSGELGSLRVFNNLYDPIIDHRDYAIHGACLNEQYDFVELLTREKNVTCFRIRSVCHTKYLNLMRRLFSFIRTTEQFSEAFAGVCYNGNMQMFNEFVDKIHVMDNKRDYAFGCGLEGACSGGHVNIVQLLIPYCTTFQINCSLSAACNRGRIECVKFLVENNVDIYDIPYNIRNAIGEKHYDVAKYLLDTWKSLSRQYIGTVHEQDYLRVIDTTEKILKNKCFHIDQS